MDHVDAALLLLRVSAGVTFMAHGRNHARSLEGTARWFAGQGFRRARLQALASAVVELGAGALLVVGLLTPLAAAALVATMVVAAVAVHRPHGFFVFRDGWEYVAILAVVGLVVGALGPGAISVDAALDIERSGWEGAAIALAGVAAAAVQLAAFWRPPR